MANLSSGIGVDDVYIGVNAPQAVLAAGQVIETAGIVGMGCWGPKNTPLNDQTPQALVQRWGPPINSGYDIVQDGALFLKQRPLGGVTAIRVTDGTDLASTATLDNVGSAAAVVFTGKYTGTFGNGITATVQQGSNYSVGAKTWKVIVQAGTFRPEIWDRIPGATAAAAWANIINAVNNGTDGTHPASQFVVAAQPGTHSVALPNTVAVTVTLAGGTNGGPVDSAQQLGTDGGVGTRTGLYALNGAPITVAWLAGNTDSTSWGTVLAWGADNDIAVGGATPPGTTPAAAVALKLTAGIDDWHMFIAVGTATYLDTYLGINVSLTQVPLVAGVYCSTSSEQSPGNRVVYGIIGTEQTLGANPQPYSSGDMSLLEDNGLIFVTNPIPSANAFGVRHGKNSCSNFAQSELAYTHKTIDLVNAFSSPVMGQFVNRLQSTRANDPLREAVEAAFNAYLGPQKSALIINDYDAICDLTNNSVQSIQAGQLNATVIIQYMSVVNQFIIQMTAGQTVSVNVTTIQTLTPAA